MNPFEGGAVSGGGDGPRKGVQVSDRVDGLSGGIFEAEGFASVFEFSWERSERMETELFLKAGGV